MDAEIYAEVDPARRWRFLHAPVRFVLTSSTRCRLALVIAVICCALIPAGGASAATGWSRQTTPNPGDAVLNGVSCVRSTSHPGSDCLGVGAQFDSVGNSDAYAMRWNGTSWVSAVPTIPLAPQSALESVSCVSARYCLAVGLLNDGGIDTPVAELYNGSGWTSKTVPLPPDVAGGALAGVACTSTTACTAVGTIDQFGGDHTPLALRWNGTNFILQSVSPPGSATEADLGAVSCPAAGSCTAVGEDGPSGGPRRLMAAHWDGSIWTTQNVAAGAGTSAPQYRGVSCPTATMCAAVGDAFTSGADRSLVSTWNGHAWTTSSIAAPGGATSSALNSVSCTSPSACTAVGADTVSSAKQAVALRFNGSDWVRESLVSPAATGNELDGVACTSAVSCTAAGSYLDSAGHDLTLAQVWGGPAWTGVPTPAVAAPKLADLFSSSCPSANWCVAVGQWEDSSGTLHGLAEVWNGFTWRLMRAIPLPTGAQGAALLSVSCPLIRQCLAVGSYQRASDNHLRPLIEAWNGSAWRMITTSGPAAALSQLEGVSCKSIGACWAVGFSQATLGGTSLPIAARVVGTAASIQTIGLSPQTEAAALHGLWCDASLNCIAGGNWDDGHGEQSLDASFELGAWRTDLPPPVSGSLQAELKGVSCTSVTACIAVGWFEDGSGRTVPLAYHVAGAAWLRMSPPLPAGSAAASLAGVSCPTAAMCMAVGNSTAAGHLRLLAQRWTGSGWVGSLNPAASTTSDSQLFGVSCAATTTCVAVGVLGSNAPLAEHYS